MTEENPVQVILVTEENKTEVKGLIADFLGTRTFAHTFHDQGEIHAAIRKFLPGGNITYLSDQQTPILSLVFDNGDATMLLIGRTIVKIYEAMMLFIDGLTGKIIDTFIV